MTPFDFINSINFEKKNLFEDPQAKKDYNAFIINRGLSYFPDTVLYANEMNRSHHLDKDCQFFFLLNSISKKKRFSKWAKKVVTEDVEVIKEYYGYSNQKAESVADLLTKEDISEMKSVLSKGGKKGNAK